MNFRILWLAFFLLAGCGVKGAPVAPQGASIPSIEEAHPDLQLPPGTIYKNKAP